MTSHRLIAEDITAIIQEKNNLVRENAQLRSLVARLVEKAADAGFKLACDEMKRRLEQGEL